MLVENNIQFYLNSKSAIKPSGISNTGDCIFTFDGLSLEHAKIIYASVQQAQIPQSFENIDSINNTLVFRSDNTTYTTYLIPEANYTATTLKNWINANIPGLSVVFDPPTLRYTFTNTSLPPGHTWGFSGATTCFEVLGFAENVPIYTTSATLTSDYVVNFFTIRNILVEINNLITDNVSSENQQNASILCSIPISTSQGAIISYNNIYNIKNRINTINNFNNLHVRLLDQDLALLDLNGVDWTMTLQINYFE